jgi:KDO2-lipid IV(A) lauroyltransferase
MDGLLYLVARILVALVQRLPLRMVARLGRAGGALGYYLDGRHRRVALKNLTMCFGQEKPPAEITALAIENFRRLGENYACAVKTASMTAEQLRPHFEFVGVEKILPLASEPAKASRVVAIGHFGNFELYARFSQFGPGFPCATTYRALPQPALNRVMQSLRERSGCRFFERRTEATALKGAMNEGGVLLGLLSDQRAHRGGLRLPFLGHECLTSAAPAVFALRYRCPLYTSVCYRTRLAHWRIEVGEEIPTHKNGLPRPTREIMSDVNRAFEVAVRRDPANWFWVHNRWKLPKPVQSPESGTHRAECTIPEAEAVS